MSDKPYLLVRHSANRGTIHRQTPGEVCNTDQAKHRTRIDLADAASLVAHQRAKWCGHCFKSAELA